MLNPIFALELRARWRAGRSFLLILGIALALSLVAIFVYQRAALNAEMGAYDSFTGAYTEGISNVNARSSVVGRELFGALAGANILIWLLLAAASAATGVARERERGLLESLQLSRMSAISQISARLGANLLLLTALQFVTLPVYSVAFLMGGVGDAEIALAFYLVGCSMLLGSALGLWFSARSHRPTNALFGTLGTLALFSVFVFYQIALTGLGIFGLNEWEPLIFLHPNALFWALSSSSYLFWLQSPLLTQSALWALLSAILVWSATRQIVRTLPPATWRTGSAWIEKLRHKQTVRPPKSARRQRAAGALLADLPLERFVRFSDPLLAREVKARFRLRRAGFWVGLVRFALFLGAVGVWLFELFWLFDAPSRAALAPYGLRALLYGGTLTLGAIAATSWTRERESGTWEGLKLSLLTPREVLRAKWLSPLVSFLYYAAPMWILVCVGIIFVPALDFLKAAFIVAAWLGLATALGLWVSWRARNGTAAIAWTTGILATLLLFLPWISALAGIDESLARARYAVGGENDYNRTYTRNGDYNDGIRRAYQNATGRKVKGPTTQTVNGRAYVMFYDPMMENWLQDRAREAEKFRAQLWAWHPGEALNGIFAASDRQVSPTSYHGPTADGAKALWLSGALPLALTFVLLILLRRDVRREQLNDRG